MKSRGSYVDAGLMLERWMQGCPDLTDVNLRELLTPIGPWKTGMQPYSSYCAVLSLFVLPYIIRR